MIRIFRESDLSAIMQIWLDTNIKAYNFISKEFWTGNCEMVKEILPKAEIKQLLDYVKSIKSNVSLSVYQKNIRAIHFYQREQFQIQSENIDDNTNEKELILTWSQ